MRAVERFFKVPKENENPSPDLFGIFEVNFEENKNLELVKR
jgi:hypothetical protein